VENDADKQRAKELREELEKFHDEWKTALRRGDFQSAQIYHGMVELSMLALIQHDIYVFGKRLTVLEEQVADIYAMVDSQSKGT
jgi:hypothetical protein